MTTPELVALLKKNPLSVGCAVLCVLVGAAIYYRSGEVPDAQAALDQKSAEAERLGANVSNGKLLKEQFDMLAAANKEIDRRLLHVGQTLSNYQYFYKLESETGVKLSTLNQTTGATVKQVGKAAFVPIGFTVTAQGNLSQLLTFLRRLESGEHYGRVLSATCGGANSGSSQLNLTVNLELLGLP